MNFLGGVGAFSERIKGFVFQKEEARYDSEMNLISKKIDAKINEHIIKDSKEIEFLLLASKKIAKLGIGFIPGADLYNTFNDAKEIIQRAKQVKDIAQESDARVRAAILDPNYELKEVELLSKEAEDDVEKCAENRRLLDKIQKNKSAIEKELPRLLMFERKIERVELEEINLMIKETEYGLTRCDAINKGDFRINIKRLGVFIVLEHKRNERLLLTLKKVASDYQKMSRPKTANSNAINEKELAPIVKELSEEEKNIRNTAIAENDLLSKITQAILNHYAMIDSLLSAINSTTKDAMKNKTEIFEWLDRYKQIELAFLEELKNLSTIFRPN